MLAILTQVPWRSSGCRDTELFSALISAVVEGSDNAHEPTFNRTLQDNARRSGPRTNHACGSRECQSTAVFRPAGDSGQRLPHYYRQRAGPDAVQPGGVSGAIDTEPGRGRPRWLAASSGVLGRGDPGCTAWPGGTTFGGSVSYDSANVAASKVNVTIETGSIDTNHAERDKHLRSDDFLDTGNFGKATFVSKQITNIEDDGTSFDVVGDFTLRGVTRSVTIEVEKVGEGEDPWGGYRVGFEGEAEIRLKDFGIDYDLGPASQVVELDLHIEAVR
ncbi:YceI family protein [Parahaliea aestuarii]|uniref:Lipid/polyisoprenoid-binding YceI-like domain-containing protein n=1 Tax=Parahaliea aestuarii TaxID=1852021 RepID=A0A5C9A1F9_9GAMM|nr:YceI family protein [Parahaliea aestuarii]TXS94693.1 hypothetical protein FVW59_01920 [Parahaliea aestuarii]